ncbi:hypothetical protein SK128_012337, partial [Halocaridina rubra]
AGTQSWEFLLWRVPTAEVAYPHFTSPTSLFPPYPTKLMGLQLITWPGPTAFPSPLIFDLFKTPLKASGEEK